MNNPSMLRIVADFYYDCLQNEDIIKQEIGPKMKVIEAKKLMDHMINDNTLLTKAYDGGYHAPIVSANNIKDCAILKNVSDKLSGYHGFTYKFRGNGKDCSIEVTWEK